MNSMKSLLVVGGTGVISYAVVNEAVKQGYKVTCINRGKSRNQVLSKSVEILLSDYRDKERISSLLKNRHFNAILDVLVYSPSDLKYSVSLFGDHCDQYLFFSSAEAYNKPLYQNDIYNEDAELINPLWSYSVNKANCENLLIKISKNYSFKYTIVRPAITYGNTRIPYAVMPPYGYHGTIIHRIINHKPLILFEGGKGVATFIRVEDFAIGLVGLLDNSKAYNQSFHVSGDEFASWKEILDITGDILGVKPIYIDISGKELAKEMPELSQQIIGGRMINQRLDNTRIKAAVPNFKTTFFLYDGIKETIDYYKKHNYLSGIDWRFDANIDRVIENNISNRISYNTSFVDYMQNATKVDKINYWIEKHKDNLLIYFINKILLFVDKIKCRFF